MTVVYTRKLHHKRIFLRSVFLFWKGSIYQLIWKPILLYYICYIGISFLIRSYSPDKYRAEILQSLIIYTVSSQESIPLGFLLGIYIHAVVTRWWRAFLYIPLTDSVCHDLCAFVKQKSKIRVNSKARKTGNAALLRKTVCRYLNLSSILCFQNISKSVKFVFPTTESLVTHDLMTEQELLTYSEDKTKFPKFVIPIVWAINLLEKAKYDLLITSELGYNKIMISISELYERIHYLFNSDWVSLPLVYYQVCLFKLNFEVVSIAVYAYLIAGLLARRMVISDAFKPSGFHMPDVKPKCNISSVINYNSSVFTFDDYFPIFSILELSFYMGWYKVSDALFNPFGTDPDDIDIVQLFGRNLSYGYYMCDSLFTDIDTVPDVFIAIRDADFAASQPTNRNKIVMKSIGFEYAVPPVLPKEKLFRNCDSNYFFTGSATRLANLGNRFSWLSHIEHSEDYPDRVKSKKGESDEELMETMLWGSYVFDDDRTENLVYN